MLMAAVDSSSRYALIAIQGPNAPKIIASQSPAAVPALKYYSGCYAEVAGVPAWVARTGYTGEDGFEVFCPAQDAERVWASLTEAGIDGMLISPGTGRRYP